MSTITFPNDAPAGTVGAPDAGSGTGTTGRASGHAPRTGVDLGATKVTFARVVRSEWTKLRTLRSTWITLLIALALSLGFAALIGANLGNAGQNGGGPPGAVLADPASTILGSTLFASLVLGVLGAMAASTEYSTGTVRATLTAVPRRLPVLGAKVLVLVAVSAVAGAVLTAGAYWLGSSLLSGGLSTTWSDPGVWAALIGNVGYLVAVTLLGLGLGTVLRSTAGSITVLVAVVFLLPTILQFITTDWVQTVNDYLPGTAGSSLQATKEAGAALSRGTASLVAGLWALVPVGVAGVLLKRRDA